MSTTYYFPAKPITNLAMVGSFAHVRLGIWVRGAHVGTLTLAKEEAADFVSLLRGEEAFTIHAGPRGPTASFPPHERVIRDDACVISEYGVTFRAGAVLHSTRPKE